MTESPYRLTIDLNTLHHLGIGLYSNIPAVLSEVVANSWDADATEVKIDIDKENRVITITDNGWGMDLNDINDKYLKVGYSKRSHGEVKTLMDRHVMGRKGIGKLSLFSIAETIEVQSFKGSARNRFVMDVNDIERVINNREIDEYRPTAIDATDIDIGYPEGTKIIIRNLKINPNTSAAHLKKRLARRFGIIGREHEFSVFVNGDEITVADRDFFSTLEFIWYFGSESEKYATYCRRKRGSTELSDAVDADLNHRISGWIGTFEHQADIDEGNNTIAILAWGKLIHEDILKDIKAGGVFTKYTIGEIRADFLDDDQADDIVTSDRQSLKEDDPRFEKLKACVHDHLRTIGTQWLKWRREKATENALKDSSINEWFNGLGSDNKKYAEMLFEKIESFHTPNREYKNELYRHGILAFETLALKQNLDALDWDNLDIEILKNIFSSMDDLEALHYYQITRGRVRILEKFQKVVPHERERVLQEYIFDHLWLLDPSWERASTDQHMEEQVRRVFDEIKRRKTDKGRIDIRYRTAAGKHIIIELKKYNARTQATELVDQVRQYRGGLNDVLETTEPHRQHIIESICILGKPPLPNDDDETNRELLQAVNARYITYDQLIQQTRDSYRDYLEKNSQLERFRTLIDNIGN